MYFKKNFIYTVWLLLYSNSINILFLFLRFFGVVTIRPYFLYDYLIIPFLILLKVPKAFTWLCFVAILLTDLLIQFSFIYLFSLSDLIGNLKFYTLYKLSGGHYVLIISVVLFLVMSWVALGRLSVSAEVSKAKAMLAIVGFAFVIYTLDFLNGNTLANKRKLISTNEANLGAALMRDVYYMAKDLTNTPLKPTKRAKPSLTFQTFASDSTGSQLLVIVESWGLPLSDPEWKQMQQSFQEVGREVGWKINFGESPFKGSTVQSELRELFNANGDYHYFLNSVRDPTIASIFDLKKKQGYSTYAIHSFTGQMFQRNTWWKKIGIDTSYFMENLIALKKISSDQLNYETPFSSLNDEDAFIFINKQGLNKKRFTYFLTVNSHLPFTMKHSLQAGLLSPPLSTEAKNQLNRIVGLINFVIRESEKGGWSKILIIGDHMPPFSIEGDRRYYSNSQVPYLVLSK